MIDNVYKHSGLGIPPIIDLAIRLVDSRAFQIICSSPIEYDDDERRRANKKISNIQENLSHSSSTNMVNLEGGTGLLKLKKLAGDVALPNGDEALTFGFFENTFQVTVHLPVEVR